MQSTRRMLRDQIWEDGGEVVLTLPVIDMTAEEVEHLVKK